MRLVVLEKGYILLSSPVKQNIIHSASQMSCGRYLWYRDSAENTHWSQHLKQCPGSIHMSDGCLTSLHHCLAADNKEASWFSRGLCFGS